MSVENQEKVSTENQEKVSTEEEEEWVDEKKSEGNSFRCAWVLTKGPMAGSICGRNLASNSLGCQYHKKCQSIPLSPSTPKMAYGLGSRIFRQSNPRSSSRTKKEPEIQREEKRIQEREPSIENKEEEKPINRSFNLLETLLERGVVGARLSELCNRRRYFFPPNELDAEDAMAEGRTNSGLLKSFPFISLVFDHSGKKEMVQSILHPASSAENMVKTKTWAFSYENISPQDSMFSSNNSFEKGINEKDKENSLPSKKLKSKRGVVLKPQESDFTFGSIFPGESLEDTVETFLLAFRSTTPRCCIFFLSHSLEWWGMWLIVTRRALACLGEALDLEKYGKWIQECMIEFFLQPLERETECILFSSDGDDEGMDHSVCRTVAILFWPHLKGRLLFPPLSREREESSIQRVFAEWLKFLMQPAVLNRKQQPVFCSSKPYFSVFLSQQKDSKEMENDFPSSAESLSKLLLESESLSKLLLESESLSRFLLLCGSGPIFRIASWIFHQTQNDHSFRFSSAMGFAVICLTTGYICQMMDECGSSKQEQIQAMWMKALFHQSEEKSKLIEKKFLYLNLLDPSEVFSWQEVIETLLWIQKGELEKFLGHPKFSHAAIVLILSRSIALLRRCINNDEIGVSSLTRFLELKLRTQKEFFNSE